ncbi:MFS monocarboxylate transporter [Hypoxylon sp. FL0890]|nr:MFS monocarboxylate transporter [Hypoxylon sp. FL0890]
MDIPAPSDDSGLEKPIASPPEASKERYYAETSATPLGVPTIGHSNGIDDEQSSLHVIIPDSGLQAWLAVIGSTAAITASYGVTNSIGTFQSYLATHQLRDFSNRDVGWIPAVNILFTFIVGIQSGPLFDRYGPRWLLAGASLLYVLGLTGMAFTGCGGAGDICAPGVENARAYVILMVTWGLACGVAAAVITTVSLAVITHWFDARKGLATGIAYAGSSLGGVMFPLVMRDTLSRLGWGWSVRIIMFVVLALLLVANALIKGRTEEFRPRRTANRVKLLDLSCFTDMRFLWITIGIGMFEFVVSAVLGILPSWAVAEGFDETTAFAVLAVYNAGSFFGRIISGAVSDRFGCLNTVSSVLVWSLAVIFALWLPVTRDRLPLLYIFAAVLGASTGSIMSMAAVCISQLCKPRDFGRYLGTSYSLVGLFCFLSIPICAEILEALGPLISIILFGAFLAIALVAFVLGRWACLGYHWRWKVVV